MDPSEIKIKETRPFELHQKVVAYKTSTAWQNIPHVSYLYEADISEFFGVYEGLRAQRLAAHPESPKITFTGLLIKLVAEGLGAAPELNSLVEYHYSRATGRLRICDDINVSLPWLLPDGRLITPVVSQVGKQSLDEIQASLQELARRIDNTNIDEMFYRAVIADSLAEVKRFNLQVLRRIIPANFGPHKIHGLHGADKTSYYHRPETERLTEKDLLSGTMTISNIGPLYAGQHGGFGLLEIVPPQAFAVGIGSVQEKPGVYLDERGQKQIGIRKTLPMCLAFDHRALDFDKLVPFLRRLDQIFAEPQIITSW
jgi:pyruvate/2-oxoglutarate dehydrogenase complex dihydrolipoamide acyltransferase (E2) component